MGEHINGYIGMEVIRKSVGSPQTVFVFSQRCESFMADVLGTTGVYGIATGEVDAGSISFYVPGQQTRTFDFKTGSVMFLASGAGQTPELQLVGLR